MELLLLLLLLPLLSSPDAGGGSSPAMRMLVRALRVAASAALSHSVGQSRCCSCGMARRAEKREVRCSSCSSPKASSSSPCHRCFLQLSPWVAQHWDRSSTRRIRPVRALR